MAMTTIDYASLKRIHRMDVAPRGEPVHSLPVSFAIAYFTAALATDLAYWRTAAVLWETFSDWLIMAGLVMTGLAVIAFVFDLMRGAEMDRLAWPHAVGYAFAVLLSLVNIFVHSRDGYTAVVPTGVTLSGLVVLILAVTGVMGRVLTARRRQGAGL
jgi:uncharacterized membrane protein